MMQSVSDFIAEATELRETVAQMRAALQQVQDYRTVDARTYYERYGRSLADLSAHGDLDRVIADALKRAPTPRRAVSPACRSVQVDT